MQSDIRNIKNMRTFYEEWSVIEVGDSAVATAENELAENKRVYQN